MIGPILHFGVKREGASCGQALISLNILYDTGRYTGFILWLTWPFGRVDTFDDRRLRVRRTAQRYPMLFWRVRLSPAKRKWHSTIDRYRGRWTDDDMARAVPLAPS